MWDKLTNEEQTKLADFMNIYRSYLNPNNNDEIDTIIDYIIDTLVKVYIEYKKTIPFISVEDDPYCFYIIKPVDGKYSLFDYLINTAIQNLDSIELKNDKTSCNYNMLKKKITINKSNMMKLHNSVFDVMKSKIDRNKFFELYYKNSVYHEIGHMFHYSMDNVEPNVVYVPHSYLSLSSFPPLKKFMSSKNKQAEIERRKVEVKKTAKIRIKNRIDLYSVLSDRYDILKQNEIDGLEVEVEKPPVKYEEIMFPPIFYINPVDEAFTECDAQVYSGMFENELFEIEGTDNLDCFYLPIDDDHILMTYSPSTYFFSSSIGAALKESVSRLSYFRTVFLGKKDLFIEFLGKYELFSARSLSHQLIAADKNNMKDVQPLLDEIVEFRKSKGKSLKSLDIYFPLVRVDDKWVYYTETIDKKPPEVLKLQ